MGGRESENAGKKDRVEHGSASFLDRCKRDRAVVTSIPPFPLLSGGPTPRIPSYLPDSEARLALPRLEPFRPSEVRFARNLESQGFVGTTSSSPKNPT